MPLSNKIGLTVTEMLKGLDAGSVRGLYVIGENPMTSDPDLNHVREAMTKCEFFVLQEIFYSETGQFADVIFPAASFVEKEGTFTNTERRIQRVRKAVPPPGEAMADSWIVTELAGADARAGRGRAFSRRRRGRVGAIRARRQSWPRSAR